MTNVIYIGQYKKFQKWIGERYNSGTPDIDIILHTDGGNSASSYIIGRLIHEYPGNVTTHVPYYAFSAGSLIVLSGDDICMNAYSLLSPLDTQYEVKVQGEQYDISSKIFMKIKLDDAGQKLLQGDAKVEHKQTENFLLDVCENRKCRDKIIELFLTNIQTHDNPITAHMMDCIGLKVKPVNKSIIELVNLMTNI